jgi:putative ABC transport system permease protein
MQFEGPVLRLYRGLLWLYPAEFRDHFAREMSMVLADRIREQKTFAGTFGVWLAAAVGVFVHAPKEHYYMISQEILYGFRMMRRDKLVTFIAILVLALGIGSTTTVFSVANGLLLRPLPYADPDKLVYVEETSPTLNSAVAYPNYLDFRARNRSLDDIAMYGSGLSTIRGEGDAERIPTGVGTEPLGRILGVKPMMGRWFNAGKDTVNAAPVVVLGEDLWRRRYGADPAILGRSITIGSSPTRVIGVMPRDFHFPNAEQMWMPLQLDPKFNTRMDHGLEGIARLHPGVSRQQAEADLRSIMEQISREHPTETYGQTVNVLKYPGNVTRPIQPVLWTLMGVVGFVLLIACANITNLLLVKASSRVREVAIRGALGASRIRLIRQLVIESLMLGFFGAIGGLILAYGAIPTLLKLVPADLPSWLSFSVDGRVLLFTLAITIGTGILVGLVPALSASRTHPVNALKEGGRAGTAGRRRAWFRSTLVIAQMALSLLLLVGAGLMIRSFLSLSSQDTGFPTENIMTFQTAVPAARYSDGVKSSLLVKQILDQVGSIPGVVGAAGSSGIPFFNNWGRGITVEGSPVLSLKETQLINHTVVTPGYFKTLGIPMVQGRDFNESDAKSPLVTIVDAALAKQYWPNQSALGKRVRFGPPDANEPWHTVIGVVSEVRSQDLKTKKRNNVYLPYGEFQMSSLSYLVRTGAWIQNPGPAIHRRMVGIDHDIAISRMLPLREVINQTIWQERFFTILFAFFAGLALLLAIVGLYGVLAYTVAQRTHEMGIRMALGASAGDLKNMVMLQSGRLVLAGVLIGGIGSVALTRLLLAKELYLVSPTDPQTFLFVSILLTAIALLASYVPARRATRIDPITALREE